MFHLKFIFNVQAFDCSVLESEYVGQGVDAE